jgi:hypothetical protein
LKPSDKIRGKNQLKFRILKRVSKQPAWNNALTKSRKRRRRRRRRRRNKKKKKKKKKKHEEENSGLM